VFILLTERRERLMQCPKSGWKEEDGSLFCKKYGIELLVENF
jgi:hypothetical protein